ncbi:hypothetical protein [Methyloferula stellata]|uniref:hypothetical protein n=1 Tax=Methyloferula stellata TaxID=876270 RepID=UPI00037A79A7|nr:hypothetical protein [Methyloferula stellata]
MKPAEASPTSDIDHYDALAAVRDRFLGFRCAIKGAEISSHADRNGLLQLAEDFTAALKEVCDSFARDRAIRTTGTAAKE